MKKLFSKAFNINEGEHGRVALSWLIFLIVMSGIILGRNARDSIFLKNVGIAYLPYMYVLNAVFVVMVSMVYSSFIDKMDRTRFMVVSNALYAGIGVLSYFLLMMKLVWFYSVCYIIVQILWLIGLMQFWTYMGDVFDARESKRLFPLISTGGLVGMIVAGFGAKFIVKIIGTESLFLIWAAMSGLCIALIITLSKKHIQPRLAASPPAPVKRVEKQSQLQDFKDGYAYVKSVNLLRTMIFINLAMWVVFTIVDYQFNKVMSETYKSKDDLTAFLGLFRAGAGFICLVVQLFVTTRLVSRFGVGRTINIHPAYMGAATAFLTVKFGYISSFVSKFGDHVLLYTIQDSSYQMLYNPIPPDKRGRARAFVEGYIKPISMGVAGVILVLSTKFFEPKITSGISCFFAFVWVYFSLRANVGYIKALTDNLSAPDLNLRAAAMTQLAKLGDAENLRVLREVVNSGDHETAVFALEMFETIGARELLPDVRRRLGDPEPAVRAAAVGAVASLQDSESLSAIAGLLNDKNNDVRRAAIKAVGKLGDEESLPLLTPLLEDKKKKIRAEAVGALFRAGGLDGILIAGETLKHMLGDEDPEERVAAVDILGALRVKHFTSILLRLMADPDPGVRLRAVRAVAKLKDPRATDALIVALADKHMARYAENGLVAIGHKAVHALHTAADNSPDLAVRCRAVRLLGKIRSSEAVEGLVHALAEPEPLIRSAAVDALGYFPWSEAQKESLRAPVLKFIKNEISHVCSARAAAATLSLVPDRKPPPVFLDAVEELAHDGVVRIFNALALVFDRNTVRGIAYKLNSSDPRMKPLALEALDNILPKDVTANLTPLFEDRNPEDTIAFCQTVIGRAPLDPETIHTQFAASGSAWMRGATAYSIGETSNSDMRALLEKLSADTDPFVRETAAWALNRISASKNEVTAMLTMEKILFLKSVPIFAGMTGEELRSLADIVEEKEFRSGEYIFHEGEPGDEMYVIVRGGVQVLRGEGAAEVAIATLGERDCLGEMSILDDSPRSAGSRASADCLMLKIHRDEFRELIREEPEVAFGVFRVFTGRIRAANVEQEQAHSPMQGSV